METIRIIYDKDGNTLHVWFDDPEKEAICEETTEEIIFSKDQHGKIIGIEVLNFLPEDRRHIGDHVPFDLQVVSGQS